jgi:uncharacterized small protein (DUF1192 family)
MKMKFVLFSIYLVLCFFATRAEVKESRAFTLVNSNGDSARCEITSFEPDSVKRVQRLKDGKEKRDGIFNKEDFKKIIEKTELKQYFACDSPYEKMNSCRLTYKSVPELHQIPPASEDTSLSLTVQTPDTNEAMQSALDNTDNLTEQKPFPVFYIILVILLLLIIILLIKIAIKKQPEHRSFGRDSIGKNGVNTQDDEIAKLKEDVAKLKNDIAGKLNLENDIKYLKEEIERLKKERATSNTAKPDTAQEITVADSENNAASTDKFFFAGPIDNTFNASRKTAEFIDGQSLYRFEQIRGSNRAVFAAEGGYESVVQRFVCSPELQAGVCDVIGNYDPNASQIRTDVPGEAVLDGNMWIVDKKAKIRYC